MEDPSSEAAESIDPPVAASLDEEEGIHSALADAVENHDLSDVISSGSSFEILSMKEGIGEAKESIDESVGVPSILESCGVDDTNSDESYRAERTKKYVMESEYEFVDDGDTTDSDPFVKVSKVNEENEDSDQLPLTGPESGKTEIPMDMQPEPEIESNTTEHLEVNESSSSENCPEDNTQYNNEISEQDNNQNSGRSIAQQTEETDANGIKDIAALSSAIANGLVRFSQWLKQRRLEHLRLLNEGRNSENCPEDNIQYNNEISEQDNNQNSGRSIAQQTEETDANAIEDAAALYSAFVNGVVRFYQWVKQRRLENLRLLNEESIQYNYRISEQDNNQNSGRNIAQQTEEADWPERHPGIFFLLIILAMVLILAIGTFTLVATMMGLPLLLGLKTTCTFEGITENFDFVQKNEFSFPRCLNDPATAQSIYQLAATVHVHQMTTANLRNASLSYEVSKLSAANQALEESLADMTARFSEQLMITKELEGRIMDRMRKPEHLESMAKRRLTKEDVATRDDERDLLTSKNRKDSSDVSDLLFRLMKIIRGFHNATLELGQGSRDRMTDVQREPVVFQMLLQLFVKTNANVSGKSLTDQLDVVEDSVLAVVKCLDSLQLLMPSKTIHDIFSFDWHQVQELISLEANEKREATPEKGNKLSLEPCRVFMPKVARNSSAGPFTRGKKELKKYLNKTLDAVDKIGRTVRSTLEAIKALPEKFFNNGDLFKSFGRKFKTTVESMNKRFYKGYSKLKDKVNRKFKTSLSELSKSVRAGWDKINGRSSSVDSILSGAKRRFWKRGAKQTEKPDEQMSNEPVRESTAEDTGKVQDQAETRTNPVEDIKSPPEDVNMILNDLEFHSQSDMEEEEVSEGETLLQVPDVTSPLDEPNWLDEHQLRKEMDAVKSESTAPMVKLSYDILKLTSGDFYSMDDLERKAFSRRLSLASAAGSDVSAWTESWLFCQQGWWKKMTAGNPIHLEELVAACRPWLLEWQVEVQDGNAKGKQSTHLCEDRPSLESLDNRANVDGHCRKDSNRKGSDWYFELMEGRENGRHDSDWYIRSKRSVSEQHQKPVRKGYRGR